MDKLLLGMQALLLVVIISNPASNPIANMYGPLFLLFYGFVIVVTLLVCRWVARQDSTANLPLPKVPTNPDPHEIAYLRGGENEVTRLVVFDLIQRGYLQVNGKIERSPNHPNPVNLSPMEREVFSWFDKPKGASEIFHSLSNQVKQHYTPYADFEKMFHVSAVSSGGGGCSSGSSCGGGGCGGGGCGGGGCGGCGGGAEMQQAREIGRFHSRWV